MKVITTNDSYIIVNTMECLKLGDLPIINHIDCPLIEQTERYELLPSTNIHGPISIVHACGNSCVISNNEVNIEREAVVVTSFKTKHDFKNTLYVINIYCMNNYFSVIQ